MCFLFLRNINIYYIKYEEYKSKNIETIKTNGQKVSPNVYFTKQTVSNACGTVGIIHSLANNRQILNIESKVIVS